MSASWVLGATIGSFIVLAVGFPLWNAIMGFIFTLLLGKALSR